MGRENLSWNRLFWTSTIMLTIYYSKFPRNSNQQNLFKSKFIKIVQYKKGCLIFWKGHVAIAISETKIIHSNVKDMYVKIENLKMHVKEYINLVEMSYLLDK